MVHSRYNGTPWSTMGWPLSNPIHVDHLPGLRPSPSVIVARTPPDCVVATCRAKAPARKRRGLRMEVSMLSHRVFFWNRRVREDGVVATLSALKANESYSRWTCSCPVRSLARMFALRAHITHSFSSVSVTLAFSVRTCRVRGTAVI